MFAAAKVRINREMANTQKLVFLSVTYRKNKRRATCLMARLMDIGF